MTSSRKQNGSTLRTTLTARIRTDVVHKEENVLTLHGCGPDPALVETNNGNIGHLTRVARVVVSHHADVKRSESSSGVAEVFFPYFFSLLRIPPVSDDGTVNGEVNGLSSACAGGEAD